jgi:hypothetical protein
VLNSVFQQVPKHRGDHIVCCKGDRRYLCAELKSSAGV